LTSKDHATDCTINVRQVTEKGKRCCQFTQTASGRLFGSPRKRCANISGTLYASLDPERALHEPRNVRAACGRHTLPPRVARAITTRLPVADTT